MLCPECLSSSKMEKKIADPLLRVRDAVTAAMIFIMDEVFAANSCSSVDREVRGQRVEPASQADSLVYDVGET